MIAVSMSIGCAIGFLFGWLHGQDKARRELRSNPPHFDVASLTRQQRLQLFGQCELCGEPACGNAHDIDEDTTIRLCIDHLQEVIDYHLQQTSQGE